MSRYIDADVLKQKYTMATTRYSGGIMERPVVVLEAIDDAPSIDIVRCSECKYWNDADEYCEWFAKAHTSADDFCSYGERDKDTNVPNKRQTERSE